jgi:DNA (cytosine-5)-methyltransferase 1
MSAPTVISLFAGCGGSTLGYQLAGFRELLAVEWDDNAVATFRLNFPDVPVYHGDIAALSVEECLRLASVAPGDLDILDGSPPCQGFSTAGKRILDDPRNGLFREYLRLLEGLRPRVFVMENVAGLVQGKMRLIFAEIMRALKSLNYRVRAALMNAMYFGVAQDRRRVIIIGVRDDLGIAPSHPAPEQRPLAIRDVIAPPPGTIGYVTASNERHTLAGRSPLRYADRPAPTLVKTGNSRMMHGWRIESITTQEAARFASFPDSFQWRADAMARIGNSVPPNFMRAIAAHIRDHILAPAIGQGAVRYG